MADRRILRIVKLHFKADRIEDFLDHFEQVKERVATATGCEQLKLQRDITDPTIVFTLSHWKSEEDLNNYRNSPFFKETWKKIKPWFAYKASAWTTTNYFDSL